MMTTLHASRIRVIDRSQDGEHVKVANCSQCYGDLPVPTWTDGEPIFCSDACDEAYWDDKARWETASERAAGVMGDTYTGEWVSVKQRLPQDRTGEYLVALTNGARYIASPPLTDRNNQDAWYAFFGPLRDVIHWMTLPPPPEE